MLRTLRKHRAEIRQSSYRGCANYACAIALVRSEVGRCIKQRCVDGITDTFVMNDRHNGMGYRNIICEMCGERRFKWSELYKNKDAGLEHTLMCRVTE